MGKFQGEGSSQAHLWISANFLKKFFFLCAILPWSREWTSCTALFSWMRVSQRSSFSGFKMAHTLKLGNESSPRGFRIWVHSPFLFFCFEVTVAASIPPLSYKIILANKTFLFNASFRLLFRFLFSQNMIGLNKVFFFFGCYFIVATPGGQSLNSSIYFHDIFSHVLI